MALLIAFSFLAGIVTVLSPCILPVLPVVLSGSVGGGKARPLGIITGFVLSFSVFTLTLSALVEALHIPPDVLRYVAAATILVFGLFMVVPALKERFSALATAIVSRRSSMKTPQAVRRGFWSGLTLGVGLGIVWTPCVGPIMASVISLALSRSVDSGSVFITLSYAAGTAVPLFLIMQGGRKLLDRFSVLSHNSDKIQKGFGVLMVVSSLALFTGADRAFQAALLKAFPSYGSGLTALEDNRTVRSALEKRTGTVPTLTEAQQAALPDPLSLGSGVWLNSPPLTLGGLKGKVVLVDFWTYSCVNCVRTLPYLRAWHDAYAGKGLVIVGVHSPEFTFEKSESNLRAAMASLGVTWPVVQDNDFRIWNAYSNRYWPAHYLYGRDGKLVSTHFGEGAYEETEMLIRNLLASSGESRGNLAADLTASRISGSQPIAAERSPETYLGYGRGERFSSVEEPAKNRSAAYSLPPSPLEADHWAFQGTWTIEGERSVSEPSSSLHFRFNAAKVYLVINPLADENAEAAVTVDGKRVSGGDVVDGVLKLDGNRLYTLLDGATPTSGTIGITFRGRAAVYAFTFG